MSRRCALLRRAYVLLLGPVYGERWPDSGLAATEEEFELARQLGKSILVFVKATKDEPDEPAQAAFKQCVENYITGRFRVSFSAGQQSVAAPNITDVEQGNPEPR